MTETDRQIGRQTEGTGAYLFLSLGLLYPHPLHSVGGVSSGTGSAREARTQVPARGQAVTGPAVQTL